MTDITVVEFESATFGNNYISELSDGPPYQVHGIALGADDVTVGTSGVKKMWPAEELEQAADTLRGTNLVVDHNNDADGVVGRVTKSGYKEGTGVVYEAELYDEDLAEKVKSGLLEVSIRGYHADISSLEEDDDTGAKVVEDIEFDNLSIVPTGAAPSNTLEMGAHAELSAAELSAFTDTLEAAELQEVEPGMWVKFNGNHGVTISQVEDGKIEVDLYEEDDGTWRSIEQTEMVSVDDISEWDVDEDDIGSAMKNDEEEMAKDSPIPMPEDAQLLYPSEEKAEAVAEQMGMSGAHSHMLDGDTWYMPGASHSVFVDAMDDLAQDDEEMAALYQEAEMVLGYHKSNDDEEEMADSSYSRGDWVNWDTRNSTEIGKVTGSYQEGDDLPNFRGSRNMSPEGDETLYALRMYKEQDGSYHPISGKPIGHYEDSVRSAEKPKNVSDMSVELGRSNVGQYDVEAEDWVQWYPSDTTEEHGFAKSVDDDTATIEVWTQNSDGEWETDGETVTKEMDEVEPWGNFPREQDEFADAIEDGDPRKKPADNEYAEENAQSEELVSAEVEKGLKNKVEEHNEEHGDEEGKKVTYTMLKDVYERGMGAYNDSHREGMTQQQWSYARVNAFLYLVRNGNPENDAYKQDNDLLPEGHSKKSEENAPVEMQDSPVFSDGQMVQWQVEPTMFGKVVHVPEDDNIVMVDVHEMEDGEPVSTGFTVTAGYSDLIPMEGSSPEQRSEDEMEELETFSDYPEAAKENAQMALDAKEETGNPNDCGTRTGWNRASQLASGEAVSEEVVGKMSAFNRHRKNSDMDDDEGRADCGWMMWKAWGGDEGVDWASRKMESLGADELSLDNVKDSHKFNSETDALDFIKDMDAFEGVHKMGSFWVPGNTHEDYMNFIGEDYSDEEETEDPVNEGESDESDAGEELQEYEMSTPDWSGTTTSDWSRPDMEDFDTDDLSEIANHFLISATDFPPENYTDLKLPVVEPNGELNVNALAAVKGGRGVSAVDGLSGEMEEKIVDWVNSTASEEFDKDWGNEEEAEDAKAHEIDGTVGRPTPSTTVGGVRVLSSDDLRQSRKSEESDVDSLTTYKVDKMTDIEEKLAELENPVAVEADEVDELRNKADRFEEMSENLEAVRERTDILDEVDRSQVEELAESDDAVVVESARYDELQDEAEQVKGVYAASLAEEYPAFNAEELSDKFSIEELREKFEEQIGDVEEELTSSADAEPQSQDPSEDELEDASGEDAEEEELSAEVAEKQEAIKNKILGGN